MSNGIAKLHKRVKAQDTSAESKPDLPLVHNETLSIAAMCVSNPDRSPLGIDGGDPARTPTGRTEVVSDDFSILV
jgi:hypothetical protein